MAKLMATAWQSVLNTVLQRSADVQHQGRAAEYFAMAEQDWQLESVWHSVPPNSNRMNTKRARDMRLPVGHRVRRSDVGTGLAA